jgi:hypothetical protein
MHIFHRAWVIFHSAWSPTVPIRQGRWIATTTVACRFGVGNGDVWGSLCRFVKRVSYGKNMVITMVYYLNYGGYNFLYI